MRKCPPFVLFPFAGNFTVKTEERPCSETLIGTGCLFDHVRNRRRYLAMFLRMQHFYAIKLL
jgi:hypothetical protein